VAKVGWVETSGKNGASMHTRKKLVIRIRKTCFAKLGVPP